MALTDSAICPVDDCSKAVLRGGFCYAHYMKQWRYGTPTPERPPKYVDITGQRFGTLIVVSRNGKMWLCRCDCGRERNASTGELNRCNDATCGHRPSHRRSDEAGYTAAHQRITMDRGPIKQQHCIDCGGQAAHWSYDHTDPDERIGTKGAALGLPYSLNSDHYAPRCVPCHKSFDLAHLATPST